MVILITLGAVVALFNHGPIPQPPSYHAFVDRRAIWGIPNFLDVMSNFFFILVGFLGLYKTSVKDSIHIVTENRASYKVFFLGVAIVGVGSGYYHWSPSNPTLVWDRLPMTIAFMALSSIVAGEFISKRFGAMLLVPLMLIGVLSVLYWHWTETVGQGDLRPYVLVQFLPILAMPVILMCFKSACTRESDYWLLFSAYVLSKLFEHFDREVYDALGFVSGHSLKHVFADIGIYLLLLSFVRRHCNLNRASNPNI